MPTVAALDDATIDAAGMLVASEHTAARRAHPSLPVAWTNPQVCTAALRRLLDAGHRGAVAIEGSRTLAVLTGTERGTYARLLAEGVAVAPDLADPTRLLVRVYGDLAPGWVARGLLWHALVALATGGAPDCRGQRLHAGAAGGTSSRVTRPPAARPCLGRAWTRPAGGPPPHQPTPAPGPPPAAASHQPRQRPRPPAPPATGAAVRHAG